MISSTSNPQVRQTAALQTRAKARREQGLFVVEGLRLVRETPPDRLERLYATEEFLAAHAGELGGLRPETVSEPLFRAMSDTQTPQGILAVVRQRNYTVEEICRGGKTPLLVLLENLQDPGNLGTILRTAEAAGAAGVIMSRDTADIYNPKAVRSTMGAVFRVPFAYADDLAEAADRCRGEGIRIFAAHLRGENPCDAEDYRDPCAFLIGNEANGLSDRLAARADRLVRIPMAGRAESLNAAVAASILMYEAARQRKWIFG